MFLDDRAPAFQIKTGCPSWRDDCLRAQHLRQLGDVEGDVPGPSSGVSSLAAPRRLNFFSQG
jgi:hypothetical protein